MQLVMVIEEEIIDSVPVEPHRCKQDGYLEAMQRCLIIKHFETLKPGDTPVFFLEVASGMNTNSSDKK